MIALGLLRSIRVGWAEHAASALLQDEDTPSPAVRVIAAVYWPLAAAIYLTRSFGIGDWQIRWIRSEEHTSELQSRGHLVCRHLLVHKKKHHSHQVRQSLHAT